MLALTSCGGKERLKAALPPADLVAACPAQPTVPTIPRPDWKPEGATALEQARIDAIKSVIDVREDRTLALILDYRAWGGAACARLDGLRAWRDALEGAE